MALRVDTRRGLVLLTVDPYDASVVDAIRELPERRYRHRSREWCVPATREHLRAVNTTLAELEERGIAIEMTKDANARFARAGIGRAIVRDNAIEISGPYSRRRLPALRSLPERRYDPDRRRWTIPLTRAGALAILALIDDGQELVATSRARRVVQQATMPTAGTPPPDRDAARTPTRRSPIPHWRHYTAGPVFENPRRARIYVSSIGLCVRIRVNPARPRPASDIPEPEHHARRARPPVG